MPRGHMIRFPDFGFLDLWGLVSKSINESVRHKCTQVKWSVHILYAFCLIDRNKKMYELFEGDPILFKWAKLSRKFLFNPTVDSLTQISAIQISFLLRSSLQGKSWERKNRRKSIEFPHRPFAFFLRAVILNERILFIVWLIKEGLKMETHLWRTTKAKLFKFKSFFYTLQVCNKCRCYRSNPEEICNL